MSAAAEHYITRGQWNRTGDNQLPCSLVPGGSPLKQCGGRNNLMVGQAAAPLSTGEGIIVEKLPARGSPPLQQEAQAHHRHLAHKQVLT